MPSGRVVRDRDLLLLTECNYDLNWGVLVRVGDDLGKINFRNLSLMVALCV